MIGPAGAANALVASNETQGSRGCHAVLKLQPKSALAVYLQGVLLARAKDSWPRMLVTKLGTAGAVSARLLLHGDHKYNEGQVSRRRCRGPHLAHNPTIRMRSSWRQDELGAGAIRTRSRS